MAQGADAEIGQRKIERGRYLPLSRQPPFLPNEIDKMGRVKIGRPEDQADGFGGSAFRGGGRDDSGLLHPRQDPALSLPGTIRVPARIEPRRRLGKAGQQGALGQTQIVRRLSEIVGRRGGGADPGVAITDAVEIRLEDLPFVPGLLELERFGALHELGGEGARARLHNLDQLL